MQDNNTARKKVYDVLRIRPDTLTHMRTLINSCNQLIPLYKYSNLTTPLKLQSLITFKQATDMTLFQEHIQVVSEHRRKRTGFLI